MEKDLFKDFLPKIIMDHWVDKSRVGNGFLLPTKIRRRWAKKDLAHPTNDKPVILKRSA